MGVVPPCSLGAPGLWEGRVRPGAPMASVPPPICGVLVTYFPSGKWRSRRPPETTHAHTQPGN